jgi:ribosome-associated protein
MANSLTKNIQQNETSSMIVLTKGFTIGDDELDFEAIRAQGSGGQNVNKVSSAIHLRFNIRKSLLPDEFKEKLLAVKDQRITKEGIIVIKAQRFRTQEKNREDAETRLKALIDHALTEKKTRLATKPTRASTVRRVDSKVRQGKIKQARKKVDFD